MEGEFDPWGDENRNNNERQDKTSSTSTSKDSGTMHNPFTFLSSSDDESSDDQCLFEAQKPSSQEGDDKGGVKDPKSKSTSRKKLQVESKRNGTNKQKKSSAKENKKQASTKQNDDSFWREISLAKKKQKSTKQDSLLGDETQDDQQKKQSVSAKKTPTSAAQPNGDTTQSPRKRLPATKSIRSTPKASHSSSKAGTDTKRWLCDVCKSVEFVTFEEACAHEKVCVQSKSRSTSNGKLKGPPSYSRSPSVAVAVSSKKTSQTASGDSGTSDSDSDAQPSSISPSNGGGKLKDPPSYSKSPNVAAAAAAASNKKTSRPTSRSSSNSSGGKLKDPPSYSKSPNVAATAASNKKTSKTTSRSPSNSSSGKLKDPPSYSKATGVAAASNKKTSQPNSDQGSSTTSDSDARRSSSNGGGKLKEPPRYSKPEAVADASTKKTSKPNSDQGSSSTSDRAARSPLHTAASTAPPTAFTGGILSAKRTRELDQYLQEKMEHWKDTLPEEEKAQYSDVILNDVRRKLALMVPTTEEELKDDKVLESDALQKCGEQIVREILKFLDSNRISIAYVRSKRAEHQESKHSHSPGTANQSSEDIVLMIDSSDDDKDLGETNQNAQATVPVSIPSTKASTQKPDSKEGEYDPWGDHDNSEHGGDKKPKAASGTENNNSRQEQGHDSARKLVTPPTSNAAADDSPVDGDSHSFGDNDNSSDSNDEQPKARVPGKSDKGNRKEPDSDANAEKSSKLSHPTKRPNAKHINTKTPSQQIQGPSMASKRTSFKSIIVDQRKSSNSKKQAPPMAGRSSSKFGNSDSSDDDDDDDRILTPPAAKRRRDDHQEGILSTDKTEALDKWLARKVQLRAKLEREIGTGDIQASTILPDEARKKLCLLVPTSEKELAMQKIFSQVEQKEYGKFLVGAIRDFLTRQGISIDKVERARKAKAATIQMEGRTALEMNTSKKRKRPEQLEVPELNQKLMGQGYYTEWLDKDGQKLCVFGTATEYLPEHSDDKADDDDDNFVTITYGENSRLLVNKHHTSIKNLSVLEVQPVNIARAWGGCLVYQEKQERMHAFQKKRIPLPSEVSDARAPILWRVPDLYTRSTIFQKSAPNMPSLCLHYAGFQLEFTVKESTVPKSGNGVFLSITSLLDDLGTTNHQQVPVFSLQPGEILDIGVYAPLTSEDETPDHVMLIRSVIQSFWCDCYSMNTRKADEAVFDISHGRGKLSREAKKSILPFVNETNDWDTHRSEIHMMEDPQGSFHYALGYKQDEYAGVPSSFVEDVPAFEQPADGKPREIFVDYGEQYELVRLRQGYPRKPVSVQERKRQLDEDEREKLEHALSYDEQQVKDCVHCVSEYVTSGTMAKVKEMLDDMGDDRSDIRERVLAAIIILQARLEQLRPEVASNSSSRAAAASSVPQRVPNSPKKKQTSRIHLRQRKQRVSYKDDDYDVHLTDPERLSREELKTMKLQMQVVVDQLCPAGSSPSTLLSSLSQEADKDSVLGMACALVAPLLGRTNDDEDEDEDEVVGDDDAES